ncbi:UDP-perosamine 4-acetyltransferase [Selenomonas ruminantium]|uniref:UDP-perosamine 4-acetyltransferase n=1 Tax=Selenomonas ruminantium TaxID=971 RepID=A0A1I3CP69_SELRU|nr:acetyltransferase [Selenomonas ruminantium]SFH76277.1 UDP-perosamine 4-acetyltransferase [Selenomonas ruminantium]
MDKPVIIIGAGGHARVLYDCLCLLGVEVLGALDKCYPKGDRTSRIPILGNDSTIHAYATDAVELVNGIGSVGDTSLRAAIYNKFKKLGYSFRTVVHPAATMARDCDLSEGVQVMAGVVVNTGVKISADSIINTGAIVDHDCFIGRHVHIAPGCTISGGVNVGDGAHLGVGATVIQGVDIGRNVLVGAGAVVLKDVLADMKVAGVPAKVI